MAHRLRHIALTAMIASAINAPATLYALDPLVVVRAFCRADGAGNRLGPASWRNVAPLVDWPLEPAWDHLKLVKGYEITTPRRVDSGVEVDLKYTVTAEVLPGKVVRRKREETITLSLAPTPEGGWLISGPPHPPHVFENAADPEALADLLQPESKYESNTALIWLLLREEGWDPPYTPSVSIPDSAHFQEVATAARGDLVVYYSNGAPYHVGLMEAEDSVLSASLNAGQQTTPFAAFAGAVRYFRPREPDDPPVAQESVEGRKSEIENAAAPKSGAEVAPSPRPRRRP